MSGCPDRDRLKCDVCRTINLAKHLKHPKPNMQMYEKCPQTEKYSIREGDLLNITLMNYYKPIY